MQSAEGERAEEDIREESAGQSEAGSERATEDCGVTVPPDPEYGSQNQPGPEQDDLSLQLHSDHSGADDNLPASTNSMQENATLAPLTLHLSNLNISEDMEDQEALPEEEEEEDDEDEFIVLDSDHPLVRRQQAALNKLLNKQLERINLALKEKLAMEKAAANDQQNIGVEMFRVQEQLAGLQTKLEDDYQNKVQTEAKHQQAKDQLVAMKSEYSRMRIQDGKAKANVSQLQVEMDNLMLQLTFTQEVSEDLRSNVKVTKNTRYKAEVEKKQAENQKLKQDFYVECLTKDMERLTQQIAMYEAQANAQAEESQAAKDAYSEAEIEMESLVMARKQLLQQWSSSLLGMKRRDEAFAAMQEAMRTIEHQGILLDSEIEGFKRSITDEQERNETLTMQLNWSQMECATTKKLINQKQAQQEALQTHYGSCLRSLKETERTLARLSKDINSHNLIVNDQRKRLEKESGLRLELEEQIMTYIQQELTNNKAAKYSKRLTCRITTLKKLKLAQLWQLENDVVMLELGSHEVCQHLDNLTFDQEAVDKEIAKYNELMTAHQNKISSFGILISQKHSTIATYNGKIYEITARTGQEDLNPLQIQMEALMTQIQELAANINSDQQLWMKRQGTLVELTQEIETNSRDMVKLQIKYTGMQQKKMCLQSQIEVEHREEMELEKNVKILRGDLLKLNTLVSKNGELSQVLEENNSMMEAEFLNRLKDAEREAIEIHMKHENTQEKKERLLNSLVEAERQIMLWEKKIQLIKETRSALSSEVEQGDVQMMKTEIHRMEVRLNQLMKQQERLLRESEATVDRRETIVLRRETIIHSPNRKTTMGELHRITQGLQRKIQDTHKHVVECEQVIRELQRSKDSLSDMLAYQKQQLIDLCDASYVLDPDFGNLHDTKDRNLTHLVALQTRSKKLKGVCEGSYKALSTSESIDAAVQSLMERVHGAGTILHRVCEEFPQHQGALQRLTLVLEAHTQSSSQGNP